MRISDFIALEGLRDATLYLTRTALNDLSLWIQDVGLFLFGVPSKIPSPLLGFSYKLEGEAVLMKFESTLYPYLNREMVSNGHIKEANTFTVKMVSAITDINTFPVNAIKMNLLIPQIEKYIALGGLFTFVTSFYIYQNCILQSVVHAGSDELMDGVIYTLSFLQPTIAESDLNGVSLSAFSDKLQNGGI